MPIRDSRRRRLKKYCIGDMREWIVIHRRSITPPVFNSSSITETYDDGVGIWASVETIDKKKALFSSVNIPEEATQTFIIRYDTTDKGFPLQFPIEFIYSSEGITTEYIVRWQNYSYEILKSSDPDVRLMYIELYARLMGKQVLAVNT